MTNINTNAKNASEYLKQLQNCIGGDLLQNKREHKLSVNNDFAKGDIKFSDFNRGLTLLDYDIVFYNDVKLTNDTSNYNPIEFTYCVKGSYQHYFAKSKQKNTIEQYQNLISSGKKGGQVKMVFKKGSHVKLNVIQIEREKFLNSTEYSLESVNKELHSVFYDTKRSKEFAFYGTYNLSFADKINTIYKINKKGILGVMMLESKVYDVLFNHILIHNKQVNGKAVETSLIKREICAIKNYANKIKKNPDFHYTLDSISDELGITQAKLQEGFKLLYNKTVTEYIRYSRLEKAKDLMDNNDCNVSQVVYTVGFSSRSYFSKIFKKRFNISPSQYLKIKHKKRVVEIEAA
ncbi:helix-turn-helix domain-containing protein [Wenyingzhuangia sp. IMCC45533]